MRDIAECFHAVRHFRLVKGILLEVCAGTLLIIGGRHYYWTRSLGRHSNRNQASTFSEQRMKANPIARSRRTGDDVVTGANCGID